MNNSRSGFKYGLYLAAIFCIFAGLIMLGASIYGFVTHSGSLGGNIFMVLAGPCYIGESIVAILESGADPTRKRLLVLGLLAIFTSVIFVGIFYLLSMITAGKGEE